MKSLRIVESVASAIALLFVCTCFFSYPALAQDECVGDCDADVEVSVAELVRCVNIGLDNRPAADCLPCDVSGDGRVTVDELIHLAIFRG